MDKRYPDFVNASDIGSWSWCPESMRLQWGNESDNQKAMMEGEEYHAETARVDYRAGIAMTLGKWLFIAAAIIIALSFVSW